MEETPVKSTADFIIRLKSIVYKLLNEGDINPLWFRGEANIDLLTPLVPKAYRDFGGPLDNEDLNNHVYLNAKGLEGNLKGTFHREANPYLTSKGVHNCRWNEYYLMQHYGLRTRLLDWTENALFALFNVVTNPECNTKGGRVWLLNPHRLNKFSSNILLGKSFDMVYTPIDYRQKNNIYNADKKINADELYRRYLEMDFEENEEQNVTKNYLPLALYPPFLDERMSMQSSCFTIFGNQVNGLLQSERKNEFLDSIEIANNNTIKEELRWMGVSHKNLSPGLEGVCKTIEDLYDISEYVARRIK